MKTKIEKLEYIFYLFLTNNRREMCNMMEDYNKFYVLPDLFVHSSKTLTLSEANKRTENIKNSFNAFRKQNI